MSDIWKQIEQLEGQTLATIAYQQSFTINRVTSSKVFFVLSKNNKERSSPRETFERLDNLRLKPLELTRARVEKEAPNGERNSSYVHSILCAIGKAA